MTQQYTPPYTIQYTREDVDYNTFYSMWSRQLAKQYTVKELNAMLSKSCRDAKRSAQSSWLAIQRTNSMQSNSQARAQHGNAVAFAGDLSSAIRAALEIHELFPEHAKT